MTEIFAKRLQDELGCSTMAPFSGTVYDLAENVCLYEAEGIKIEKSKTSPKAARAARAFEKLLSLGHRLLTVIRKTRAVRIKTWNVFHATYSLCDKWDRTDVE